MYTLFVFSRSVRQQQKKRTEENRWEMLLPDQNNQRKREFSVYI